MPRAGQRRQLTPSLDGVERLDLGSAAAGQPKQGRLRDFLAGQIAAGQLRPGDALPTELQLAERLSQIYEGALRSVREAHGGWLPENRLHHGKGGFFDPAVAEAEILESLHSMLTGPSPITAIFATFDSIAELICLLLTRLGVRVPEDVSLVSFGGTFRQGAIQRLLTSVTVDEAQIGREAADLLHRMRRGELPLETDMVHVMPVSLSDGQTLAAAGKDRRKNNCRTSQGDSPIFAARKSGQSPTCSFAGPK